MPAPVGVELPVSGSVDDIMNITQRNNLINTDNIVGRAVCIMSVSQPLPYIKENVDHRISSEAGNNTAMVTREAHSKMNCSSAACKTVMN